MLFMPHFFELLYFCNYIILSILINYLNVFTICELTYKPVFMPIFKITLFFSLILIVSCSSIETKRPEYTYEQERRIERYGEGVIEAEERWKQGFARLLGEETSVDLQTINDILWETSLEKISFMPLNSVDKLSGTIITEWYQINEKQKIKINLFINDNNISDQSLTVKIYEEQLIDSSWQQVNRNADLENKIKDSILSTAKKLKLAQENL